MALGQLFLQSDSAYACIRELGELGKVHFRDVSHKSRNVSKEMFSMFFLLIV
jgi:hypothetical protein